MREEAVQLGESLLGIVTVPSTDGQGKCRSAFIFLNSGLLHRVGPNRLHVTIARDLAELGFVSLRLDFSGIGDSPASAGRLPVAARWVAETQQAMNYLMATKNVDKFILIGNCSGAYIAARTSHQDPRVRGAILINLQGPKTYMRYYFKLALANPKVWRRLFAGAAKYRDLLKSARGLAAKFRARPDQNRPPEGMDDAALRRLAERRTKLFLIYCFWDPGLHYFKASLDQKLQHLISQDNLRVEIIPGMNHDFNLIRGQMQLRQMVRAWAGQLESEP